MEESSSVSSASNLTNSTANASKNVTKDSLTSYSSTNFSARTLSSSTRTLSNEEIELRRSGFEKFITSLPKVCSPTICGLLNYRTPNSKLFSSVCSSVVLPNNSKPENSSTNANTNRSDETSGYHTSSCKVDNSTKSCCDAKLPTDSTGGQSCAQDECRCEFKNLFEEKLNHQLKNEVSQAANGETGEDEPDFYINNEFDWSIDQIALLNPCDITIDDNILLYKEFEELNRSLLNKEGEEFFKRKMIAPSPIVDTPILARKRLLQNICKTSSPFVEYLNAKQQSSVFKTPLQLSDIKETSSSSSNLSFKTPQPQPQPNHHTTPLNNGHTSKLVDEKVLPKKKLFHKFELSTCSSKKSIRPHLMHSLSDSHARKFEVSPALSEIGQARHNQFNCTDIDYKNFSLDLSDIGNEINLNESLRSNHFDHYNPFKASTNRKEIDRPIREEDELEGQEEEAEIKRLDLNDTHEMIELDKVDSIEANVKVDALIDDGGRNAEMNNDEMKEEMKEQMKEEMNDGQTAEDVRMSVSMLQPSTEQCSMMDCSFDLKEDGEHELMANDVNELCNAKQLLTANRVPNATVRLSAVDENADENQESLMETSSLGVCSLDSNNFNHKIDSACKSPAAHKNQQLTSTPFRF